MDKIPKNYSDLLQNEVKAFALLATLMKDGSPQLTPLWFSTKGEYILINSAIGRIKDRNMRRNPHIALTILDPHNPYRYIQIRGTVVEITSEGARDHINLLSNKYTGRIVYTGGPPEEIRVIYKILPQFVSAQG